MLTSIKMHRIIESQNNSGQKGPIRIIKLFLFASRAHLNQGSNLQHQYRLEDEEIKSSPAQKDLGIRVDEKLDISWKCTLIAQKANYIQGCIKRSVASRSMEAVPGETPPGMSSCGDLNIEKT